MNAVFTVIKEHFKNFYLIQRLAQFQLKISNHDNYLGLAWELINPVLQIFVYWFAFGVGIRQNKPIDDVPFIFWLLVGISAWFFVNQGILEGTKSIGTRFNQVAKMNFPLSAIPAYILTSKFYGHLVLTFVIVIICMTTGIFPSLYLLQLLIYMPMLYAFAYSVSMLTSTLGVLIRDTQMAMQAILRMLFYLSPILWIPDKGSIVEMIMKFNPVYFYAESYRAAILYDNIYLLEHWKLALYNVSIIALFFVIGSILHMKFRQRFADFL
ncbi:ABC transporter permease [Mammaliicoccus stepanovicii]|uniref:Transport permease protein n=1 Tax=Mammaliicoccus stepanovicii TaxID=643214 RepID=A0A239ZRU1_9STAP|nr:ABC transporter permease [Mammaliicoccus stepanovicii]PNZ73693.1 ABC transporter permease [Mammaliicoccus stepanovicii]GGI43436.1 transport permease protein [Mammaliicoccus stepanovicii]SNV73514.1 teichoic acid translocation permease TagG [Mammaliicoccus stepanovicii]